MDGEDRMTTEPALIREPAAPETYHFFGSYDHAIDNKGRMIIPNVYRGCLGATFTIGPTTDFQGIGLYPDQVFDRIISKMMEMNQRKPVVQKVVTQFAKLSYRGMQTDGQGRVLLPAKLRQRMLGEARELEISGEMKYVRVMDIAKARQGDEIFMAGQEEILEIYGDLGE